MKTKSFKLILAAITLLTAGTATQAHAGNDWYAGQPQNGQRIIAIRAKLVNGLSAKGGLQSGGWVRFGGVPQYFVRNAGTATHPDGTRYLKFVFSNTPARSVAQVPVYQNRGGVLGIPIPGTGSSTGHRSGGLIMDAPR